MKSPFLALACAALLIGAAVPAGAQLKLPGQKPSPLKPSTQPPSKPASTPAPEKPGAPQAEDGLSKYIEESFKRHGGRTLCIVEDTSVSEIRAEVVRELKRNDKSDTAPVEAVAAALWTAYPCPFSPYRVELRPATAKDVEGAWLFPESSQPYRYGPRSPNQPGGPAVAIRCEVVGYFPGGELRSGLVRGDEACPFSKAADLEPARSRPRVSSWSMLGEGRLKVTRSDVADHLEEWEVYVVTQPFGMHAMDFKEGDLVAFLRKEKGNDINAATEFRHLQRLP